MKIIRNTDHDRLQAEIAALVEDLDQVLSEVRELFVDIVLKIKALKDRVHQLGLLTPTVMLIDDEEDDHLPR